MAEKLPLAPGNPNKRAFTISDFTQLNDVPSTYSGAAGEVVTVNSGATGLVFQQLPAPFGDRFINLSDVPASYVGAAGEVVAVNSGATGLVFQQLPAPFGGKFINLSDVPTSYSGAAGEMVTVNSGANGLQFQQLPVSCITQEIKSTNFSTAALTNNISMSLPAGAIIIGSRLKVNTTFQGGAITNYYLSIGIASYLENILAQYDATNISVSSTEYAEALGFQSFDISNITTILVTATSVGANLNAATQGDAMIEIFYLNRGY